MSAYWMGQRTSQHLDVGGGADRAFDRAWQQQ
jgi:hypothetical protein